MPKFTGEDAQNSQTFNAGTFQFSGQRPEKLTSTEYTLATIAVDVTGSVSGFEAALLQAIQVSVDACRKSPRAENLLIRVILFNSYQGVQEVHGFLPLSQIDTAKYGPLNPLGGTNLYDAVYEGVGAMNRYAKMLVDNDFLVNGALFVITDGDNNDSKATPRMCLDEMAQAKSAEIMESLHSVLVGINVASLRKRLEDFQNSLGIAQFVDITNATAGNLAKVAQFVSKSISSQSQSLGSGGPSQPLTF